MEGWTCTHCNTINRSEARFCAGCGAKLPENGNTHPSEPVGDNTLESLKGLIQQGVGLLNPLVDSIDRTLKPSAIVEPQLAGKVREDPLPQPVNARSPGEVVSYFTITETITAPHSPYVVYYQAFNSASCPQCKRANPKRSAQFCPNCGTPYPTFIIRQSSPSRVPKDTNNIQKLLNLSQKTPNIIPYYNAFEIDEQQYLVMLHPKDSWRLLASLPIPQPQELALAWCISLAKAMASLHDQGLVLTSEEKTDLRNNVIILNEIRACFSDLTTAHQPVDTERERVEKQRDMRLLARLLYLLVTGQELRASATVIPISLRRVVETARQGRYTTIQEMILDMQKPPVVELTRSLRQMVGYATHVGKVRDHNEDFVGTYSFAMEQTPGSPQIGLLVVADGMGGHEAGERASKQVVSTVMSKVQELQAVPALKGVTRPLRQAKTASDVLRDAIQQSNNLLYAARQKAHTGIDRGTTLNAVLIIGDSATVANVGDSRTYLLRGGMLQQITQDHSLVASLISAGLITDEEARKHPQRNQIFRTMGDKPNVEVDTFPQVLSAGDCLLLCSDGLWEMIRDDDIQSILLNAPSPQAACDELIQAANDAGGEDNISVIVVKLE